MILAAAVDLFAERGFGAQTKELATRLGISEALIYKYFPTKDVLVEKVYEATILSRWDPSWEEALRDRSRPFQTRLTEFFLDYLGVVDDPVWARIVMYSSLDGLDLTRGYILAHVDHLMAIVSQELEEAIGPGVLSHELVWHLQSTFIYYLMRKHIHRTPVEEDLQLFVPQVVESFLRGVGYRPGVPSNE